MSGHLIAVYGSLLRGERNHVKMSGARFVRSARTEASFTLIDLGPFPALYEGGGTNVALEVFEVTDAHLAALDRFEGVPHLYVRTTIRTDDGATVQAYVQRGRSYSTHDVIASGDWRAYRKERANANTAA